MAIHIGKIIKDTLKSREIDVTDFAKRINYTRGNAYKIFNKSGIDTELLLKINKVLGENLFLKYVSDEDIIVHKNSKTKMVDVMEALKTIDTKVSLIDEKLKPKTGKKK
ncbi:MAG TPA: hypothetical protein VNX01_02560 [Bacteroidia bacterium]|jgi:plasmid maintenance system antidote protein VapI|nr:hypothetical protein [Bacteroidia bacterium]